jgi:hypothetical protein
MKSKLQLQLSDELSRAIIDHILFFEVRDAIDLLVSMIEMAYGLPYKHDNHTTAINLIDAHLEKSNSQTTFAREQDMLEMTRILHTIRVEACHDKTLILELLFNQIGGIFKRDEEAPKEDDKLQAALSTQVCKVIIGHRSALANDRTDIPRKPRLKISKRKIFGFLENHASYF